MQLIRRALLGAITFLATALPASAQMSAAAPADTGPSLLLVWGWILIAGVIIFIVGTSLGVKGGK